jgi:hypothetical protein
VIDRNRYCNAANARRALLNPESADLLILPHEVSSFYPERKPLLGMTFDPDNDMLLNVNPQRAFK